MTEARRIIATIRDGGQPLDGDLEWFAAGLGNGQVSDAQAGAFAMAVLLRGLGEEGRVALTRAMRDSGDVLAWPEVARPVGDKHSTGGVGDFTSLLLVPALVDCGLAVPMISGRGLGHTGGTLDKLESIPGFRTDLDESALRRCVGDLGGAIVAATTRIAPADRRLYAIRDVTGTVASLDLITASILSKKLAAGLQSLVLDVKFGNGAFMPSLPEAQALARALVDTANGAGCRTVALISDMNQPLARTAGNALEMAEAMEILTNPGPSRVYDLSLALGGELLALAGLAADAGEGAARMADSFVSGRAADHWGRIIAAQGGPADFVDRWRDHLPKAPIVRDIHADAEGCVTGIDTRAVGEAVVRLGGGRLRDGDRIDLRVGFSDLAPLGERVDRQRPLARVHAATEADADRAAAGLRAAFTLGDSVEPGPLVVERTG